MPPPTKGERLLSYTAACLGVKERSLVRGLAILLLFFIPLFIILLHKVRGLTIGLSILALQIVLTFGIFRACTCPEQVLEARSEPLLANLSLKEKVSSLFWVVFNQVTPSIPNVKTTNEASEDVKVFEEEIVETNIQEEIQYEVCEEPIEDESEA